MKVEEESKARVRGGKRSPSGARRAAAARPDSADLAADVLKHLPGGADRRAVCAPGRLDVIGGIAEYTGALVLAMPLARSVCVGVDLRSDGNLSVATTEPTGSDGSPPVLLPFSRLYDSKGALLEAQDAREVVPEREKTLRGIVSTLVEALRSGIVSRDLAAGITIVVGSTLRDVGDAGWETALTAALLCAVTRVFNVELDAQKAVDVCQRVDNDWHGWPVGPADAVCALQGEPDALMQVQCESREVTGTVPLPDDLAMVGVECGDCRPDAKAKYERVRTAAFMGRLLVDRIIKHDGGGHGWWDGYLSRISIPDYVERFRDRIPTRMKGKEFLDRFGETGDPLTRIDPDLVYKIRSRTEHHIYEHARACRFVECLSRGMRTGDHRILLEAGELMYASHWSYGQRCGLGDVRTDLLVSLIRKHGVGSDIYGAKISGRGCGGMVAVLMRATDRAASALEDARKAFESQTGQPAHVLHGSSPGALATK